MPQDRIGVLVGREGNIKNEVEEICSVNLSIDSETGVVNITTKGDISKTEPFKAVNIVTAISRGFSPERAFRLLDDDTILEVIDLRDYVGKSKSALTRIRGRIIGINGKSRRLIEELSGGYISVYGHTAAIIGTAEEVKSAGDAVRMLASGSAHRTVYKNLQKARTKAKLDRLKLWEE
ncbi:MAG: KH domain-containing protein [Nitrososphaerales archaeon]